MPGAPSWARSASPATPPTTTRPAPSPASRPPAIAPTPAEPPRVRLDPGRQETPRTRDPVQGASIASERKAVSGRLRPDEFRTQAFIDRSAVAGRSEEHTSELQSLMRLSYAVFCLKKK